MQTQPTYHPTRRDKHFSAPSPDFCPKCGRSTEEIDGLLYCAGIGACGWANTRVPNVQERHYLFNATPDELSALQKEYREWEASQGDREVFPGEDKEIKRSKAQTGPRRNHLSTVEVTCHYSKCGKVTTQERMGSSGRPQYCPGVECRNAAKREKYRAWKKANGGAVKKGRPIGDRVGG